MNKLVVVTKTDQVSGFRLAGVDAIGVDDVETVAKLITSWLNKREEILLALDDGLFSQLEDGLIKQVYNSEDMLLVTIPDRPVAENDLPRKQHIYDMIRHATGVKIRFKGEGNGSNR